MVVVQWWFSGVGVSETSASRHLGENCKDSVNCHGVIPSRHHDQYSLSTRSTSFRFVRQLFNPYTCLAHIGMHAEANGYTHIMHKATYQECTRSVQGQEYQTRVSKCNNYDHYEALCPLVGRADSLRLQIEFNFPSFPNWHANNNFI